MDRTLVYDNHSSENLFDIREKKRNSIGLKVKLTMWKKTLKKVTNLPQ